MAKKTINALSTFVRPFAVTMADAIEHGMLYQTVADQESEGVSVVLNTALLDLRAACGDDTGRYLSAYIELFGNGRPAMAKDYLKGVLPTMLSDRNVTPEKSIKTLASYNRTNGKWIADPANFAKCTLPNGSRVTLRGIYKMAHVKPAPIAGEHVASTDGVTRNDADESAPSAPSAPTADPENVEQYVTRVGILNVLGACAKLLRADKSTSKDGAAIASIAEAVQAHLTKKAA